MEEFNDEIRAMLRLTLVKGVGPRILRNLLNFFGSATAIFEADLFQLRQVEEVGSKVASAILDAPEKISVEKELALCKKHGIRIVTDSAPEYPRLLRTLEDAPGILYMKGTLLPQDNVSIAVIGTRHATIYGERQTERITGELVRAGFCIVSGLARGIDGLAHKAALDHGGRTIAVLGHGLGMPVYPPENQRLAQRILDSGGAIISEYAPMVSATAYTFPQRNRLIAGMTLGTAVIEAGSRSGTTLTAQFALEYGREVFAMPGPVDSRSSTGCHRLIREGARLLESVEDVLQELGPIRERFPKESNTQNNQKGEKRGNRPKTPKIPEIAEIMTDRPAEATLTEIERQVFDAIPKTGMTVDELTQTTGIPVWKLMPQLTNLELKRLIQRGAGQRVFRI